MSDNESDDAPEAVSFGASKTEALEKFQLAAQAAKEEKSKLKDKRKERDQLFKAQKEEKLARLATLMPTEEELRQLPQKLNNQTDIKRKADSDKTSKNLSTKTIFREEGDDFDEPDNGDFLSLSTTTKFRVVHTKKELISKHSAGIAESVLKFKETMLYGRGSKIRREPSQDVVRRKEKVKFIQNSIKKSKAVV